MHEVSVEQEVARVTIQVSTIPLPMYLETLLNILTSNRFSVYQIESSTVEKGSTILAKIPVRKWYCAKFI